MARTKKELLPMDQLIAEYLRESIEESGVTYRELSSQTGMSLNRIGIILRKEPPPATIGEVSRLAMVLHLSASALLARAERALAKPLADELTGDKDAASIAAAQDQLEGEVTRHDDIDTVEGLLFTDAPLPTPHARDRHGAYDLVANETIDEHPAGDDADFDNA